MRRLALLVVPLALAACGSSQKSAPSTTIPPATTALPATTTSPALPPLHPAAGKVVVAIKAQTHTPRANTPWHYAVRVTSKGRPVSARLYLQILFKGTEVGNIGTHLVPTGKWAETIRWPTASAGHALVFEARAVSSGRIGTARYPVQVK